MWLVVHMTLLNSEVCRELNIVILSCVYINDQQINIFTRADRPQSLVNISKNQSNCCHSIMKSWWYQNPQTIGDQCIKGIHSMKIQLHSNTGLNWNWTVKSTHIHPANQNGGEWIIDIYICCANMCFLLLIIYLNL